MPSCETLPAPSVKTMSPGCAIGRNLSNRIGKRRNVCHARLPCPGDATGESFRRDAFDWLLACRINVEQTNRVGIGEGGCELIHQIASTGKAVRLEDNMHAPESALASRGQSRADFRWMMAVIVNHADARRLAFELKAPVHAAKAIQRERICSAEISSTVPTAIAAVAFRTLCVPGTCSVNSPRSFSLYLT